jgi:acetolactate synthase-1/2/3 large subunit
MKGCDYVAEFLAGQGCRHVFTITGGAIAFVVDAVGRRSDMEVVCMQHEQAAAMAADAYSRFGKGLGVTMATSGPGATNLITGIACSYFDSIPTIHITGQVPMKESKIGTQIRQVGFQETDIVSMVKPITKYAVLVTRIDDLRYELEKAYALATSGRMGPVLLDIPMNVQQEDLDYFSQARRYLSETGRSCVEDDLFDEEAVQLQIDEAIVLLAAAKRPVVVGGFGIRLAQAEEEFLELIERLQFPVLTSWSALDLVPHDHPLYVGQFGVYGNRGANLTVQNCDLLLAIGSRLDTRQTGGNPGTFAREAVRIIVDVDRAELEKRMKPSVAIWCDARRFLDMLTRRMKGFATPDVSEWKRRVQTYKDRYPTIQLEYFSQREHVNPYVFAQHLNKVTEAGDILVADCGGNLTWIYQGISIKRGVRIFTAAGNSPMGYSLPAAIGACLKNNRQPILCFIGDGGLQINIQELQTICARRLPVKIFVLNNHCYGIIKQFQDTWCGSRYVAADHEGGYTVPDFRAIAAAYGIDSLTIAHNGEIQSKLENALEHPGPMLIDVRLDEDQKLTPKTEFGNPIEDCSPMLPDEEFHANMIVKPLQRRKG